MNLITMDLTKEEKREILSNLMKATVTDFLPDILINQLQPDVIDKIIKGSLGLKPSKKFSNNPFALVAERYFYRTDHEEMYKVNNTKKTITLVYQEDEWESYEYKCMSKYRNLSKNIVSFASQSFSFSWGDLKALEDMFPGE